jgi:integrase
VVREHLGVVLAPPEVLDPADGGEVLPVPRAGSARSTVGITVRHSRSCATSHDRGAKCSCAPRYQGFCFDRRSRRLIRKTFPSISEAKSWRQDALPALRRGALRASTPTTLRAAWETWLTGARAGEVRTRSGDAYKPATLASYSESMQLRVLRELGTVKLSDITRRDVQRLADQIVGDGCSPSTARNALMGLRVIYRRALRDGLVAVNPCDKIDLPANRSARVQIVSAEQAAALVDALETERDRGLWATAFFAGLRRGELLALRWRDIDFAAGELHVERSYDSKARAYVEPKSRAGRRRVPIAALLRAHLRELALASDRSDPDDDRPRPHRLEGGRAGADRPARSEAHGRVRDDRRRRQREGALRVPRPLEHHDHIRSLRPPAARLALRSGNAARRLPRARVCESRAKVDSGFRRIPGCSGGTSGQVATSAQSRAKPHR